MAKSASGTEIVGKLRQADVLLAQGKTGTEYLYGHDHLYSPAVLFSSSGTVSVRYEYDAYGRRRQYTAGWVPSSLQIWGNFYAFTGRELDYLDGGNLQVMYYRARYYDTDTGRFLQRDILKHIDGMNLYEYVKSCPLIYNDPLGMIRLSLPRIGGSWNLQGTKCNLTGSLDFSYDVEEDLWLLYRKISVQVSANFTLANETRKNCKTEYRSTKLTIDDPIYSLEYPPRISVRASLSSSTTTGALSYTIGGSGDAWYNYEVSRTLGLSVDVGNIKKWIGRCCKCLIGSGSMTVSMSARDKVGSEAAVVGLVAIVAAAPESIPYFLYKAEAALKAVILSAPAF